MCFRMAVLGGWGVAAPMEGVELGGGKWNAGAIVCAVWGHALWGSSGETSAGICSGGS